QIPREELDRRLTATDELSGLLNHALDALQRLRTQRGFSEPESIQRAWSDFHATTDPLAVWLDRFTLDDPDAFVPAVTLRTAYNAECEQRGRPGLGERSFGRALRQHRPRVERTKRTVSAKHQWCYVGIGLNHSDNGHGPNGPNGPLNPIINQPEGRLFQ
ncbi:MAG: hypothetical protein HQ567_00100, partial [Candidatus Nealsonbacteria bacterium]|nr:hypothetical protein [Candidatus Nealsonbacteria bacterium]